MSNKNSNSVNSALTIALGSFIFTIGGSAYGQSISLANSINLGEGAGEVISYTNGTLAVTNNPVGGVSTFTIGNDFSFNNQTNVDFSGFNYNDAGFSFDSVTSVAIDGRGFGFAALQNGMSTVGKMGVFNTSTGSILGTFNVGNMPDMVRVSGNRVLFANEGEFGGSAATDTAGSVSYFDFSGATSAADVVSSINTNGGVNSIGFSGFSDMQLDNLNIRRHDNAYAADESFKNLEPEYVAVSGDTAFVTLQENNAIAVIDLNTNQVQSINDLGTHTVTIDGSDRNGIAIDDTVKGLVMPDAIEVFEANGKTYVVVGSEGDARGDDADIDRAKNFSGIDAGFTNPEGLTIDLGDETGIGRLDLVKDFSDPDGDGDLDDIVALSSRDVTVYEYDTIGGTLIEVGTVEGIENFLASVDPTRHNANDGGDPGEADKRSDNKGPELEAVDVTEFNGKTIAVVAAERQGGLFLVDLDDPTAPTTITSAYTNGFEDGLISPETVQFGDVNGRSVIFAGFEGDTGIAGGIGIYQVVPEPETYALIFGCFAIAFAAYKRRK